MVGHRKKSRLIAGGLLGACLLWSYWPSLATMADRWSSDPRYAHGYFVPIFAAALLWMRRGRLAGECAGPSSWGLALLVFGAAVELGGAYYHIQWLEGISLLPYLGGLALIAGGREYLKWAWPSIAFLAFMVPPPWRIETALGSPLQAMATGASTYLLQTMGFMAFAEGNVIQLDQASIGVVDACNGLSMLMTFLALSTAAAMVVRRPLLDRLVLVASSIPVALAANIARICLTGILHETVGGHAPSTFYHDLAGWVMMPLALVLYWLEIAILSRLLVEDRREAPTALVLAEARRPLGTMPSARNGYSASSL